MVPKDIISSLLHHCSKIKSIRHGFSLHASVIKAGIESDVVVSNHVLNMYAKCGKIRFAHQVFDEMSERNLVSWSALISGYVQAGEPLMAMELFSRLQLVPNEFVFASAITACANRLALIEGRQFHAKAMKLGCDDIPFVSSSLISMYMKCGRCDDALLVHYGLIEPNCVTYNVLVSGFVEMKEFDKGFHVFKLMCQHGFVPNRCTFVAVMEVCTSTDNVELGKALHCQMVKLNLDSTVLLGNVVLMMYSKFNLIEDADRAFRLIEEKDVISWNTLIAACSHCDDHMRGLNVFRELTRKTNLEVDDFTFTSALAACAGIASIRRGKEIHALLVSTGRYHRDVGVGNALVNMYAKSGCIEYAYYIFNRMIDRNLISWNTIIAGFGNHGLAMRSIELFEQMKALGVKPDSATFTGLLAACNHAGLVDIGRSYFNAMEETYRIQPHIEHFSCLIDMLGRSGRLNEAVEYASKLSDGHDPIVLGSLLSSSHLHGDVVIGERLAKEILKFAPTITSPFVLLSNLYASDGMWKRVVHARKLLRGSGLVKEPGHSLIDVKGTFEKFTIRDFSHSMMVEIKDMLEILCRGAAEVVSC